MNEQEIFNKVASHLLKQNRRAVDEERNCKYRSPTGGHVCSRLSYSG